MGRKRQEAEKQQKPLLSLFSLSPLLSPPSSLSSLLSLLSPLSPLSSLSATIRTTTLFFSRMMEASPRPGRTAWGQGRGIWEIFVWGEGFSRSVTNWKRVKEDRTTAKSKCFGGGRALTRICDLFSHGPKSRSKTLIIHCTLEERNRRVVRLCEIQSNAAFDSHFPLEGLLSYCR